MSEKPVPRLSQSTANILLNQSPAHAYAYHKLLGNVTKKSTKALDLGTLIDALLLGPGKKKFRVLDYANFTTKVAQAAKADAIAAGEIPVLREKYEEAEEVCIILRDKMFAKGISLVDGFSHYEVEWKNAETGVLCRGELDHLLMPDILDVKTAASAKPDAFARSVQSYGYDVQAAAYIEAVEFLRPDLVGRVTMRFVVAETEPPYAVTPITLDGQFKALGRAKWLAACARWKECLSTGVWPDYGTAMVSPKPWMMTEALGLEGVSELVIE